MDIIEWPHVEIPLSDGTVLAARIWLPADAANRPVPAILEYLPYRKRDGTVVRDELTYPWFAERGYAERPGRWVATNGWPDKLVEMHSFALADGARLIRGAGDLTEPVPVCTPLTAGTGQGEYCAIWAGPTYRPASRRCLCRHLGHRPADHCRRRPWDNLRSPCGWQALPMPGNSPCD